MDREAQNQREVKLPLHYTKSGLGREDPKVKSKSVSTTHPSSGRRCYWETEDIGGRELDESDGEVGRDRWSSMIHGRGRCL